MATDDLRAGAQGAAEHGGVQGDVVKLNTFDAATATDRDGGEEHTTQEEAFAHGQR